MLLARSATFAIAMVAITVSACVRPIRSLLIGVVGGVGP